MVNGQCSSWEAIKSGVQQGSVLDALVFEIYKWHDLSNNSLSSTCKIFADDTSLFSFVHDEYVTHNELNNDLKK